MPVGCLWQRQTVYGGVRAAEQNTYHHMLSPVSIPPNSCHYFSLYKNFEERPMEASSVRGRQSKLRGRKILEKLLRDRPYSSDQIRTSDGRGTRTMLAPDPRLSGFACLHVNCMNRSGPGRIGDRTHERSRYFSPLPLADKSNPQGTWVRYRSIPSYDSRGHDQASKGQRSRRCFSRSSYGRDTFRTAGYSRHCRVSAQNVPLRCILDSLTPVSRLVAAFYRAGSSLVLHTCFLGKMARLAYNAALCFRGQLAIERHAALRTA